MIQESWRSSFFKQYGRGTKTLTVVTESEFSTLLPKDVVSAWNQTFITMKVADDALDNCPKRSDREKLVKESLQFLSGYNVNFDQEELAIQLSLLKDSLSGFSKKQKEKYIRTLGKVCCVTEKIKNVEDVETMSSLLRLEGQITSRLFIDLLPDDFRANQKFKSFSKIMTRMGRFGNIFDSFLDLKEDYENNEIKVDPSNMNRYKLLASSSTDLINIIKTARINTFLILGWKFTTRVLLGIKK